MPSYDKVYKRATFGTLYPSDDVTFLNEDRKDNFKNKTDEITVDAVKRIVNSKRMTFDLDNKSFEDIIFKESNFHNAHGDSITKIDLIKFKGCDFKKCFFGSVYYEKVKFTNCTFERCDFMNADFSNCDFKNCTFKKCSGYNVRFNYSDLDPTSFLESIVVPIYNFDGLSSGEKKGAEREWIRTRISIARQLLKSSIEICNSSYSDKCIYEIKKEESKERFDILFYGESITNTTGNFMSGNWFFKIFKLIWNWIKSAILFITRGGTSLSGLGIALIVLVAFISLFLSCSEVSYANHLLKVSEDESYVFGVIKNLPHAFSLFLTYGYSSFSSSSPLVYLWLNCISAVGLIWYALSIAVIVRRIHF